MKRRLQYRQCVFRRAEIVLPRRGPLVPSFGPLFEHRDGVGLDGKKSKEDGSNQQGSEQGWNAGTVHLFNYLI